MLDTLCIFNNLIYIPNPSNSTIVAYSCRFKSTHEPKFTKSLELSIPLPTDFCTETIFFEVTESYLLGLKCMIVLVVSFSGEISIFVYCGTIKNTLMPIKNTSYSSDFYFNPNSNVFVTHGPTFLLLDGGLLQAHLLSHNFSKNFDLRLHLQANEETIQILHCASVGQLKEATIVILLIVQHKNLKGHSEMCGLTLGINTIIREEPVALRKLCVSNFFMPSLTNIMYIHVYNISISKQSCSTISEINWGNSGAFVCTNEECSVFCNGKLKYMIALPLSKVASIRTELCDLFSEINLILTTNSEEVYFYASNDAVEHSSLQLKKSWSDVKHILIGDFMLNGMKQLLMIKDISPGSWQDGCILCDVSNIVPIDFVSVGMSADSAMNKAIPGMLSKVQAGKLSIADAESRISQKVGATLDALHMLNGFTSTDELVNHHVSSFREHLVDLILHNDTISEQDNRVTTGCKELDVLNHRTRLVDNRWVLFWTFKNNCDNPICNPTLNLFIDNQPVQCLQRLFVHRHQTFSIEDQFRKQVKPNETFSLVASLDIPEFHSENIKSSAALSFYAGSYDQLKEAIHFQRARTNVTQHQLVLGKIGLSAKDVFSMELKDIADLEDLSCVKVVQKSIVLVVECLHSVLENIESLLSSKVEGGMELKLFVDNNTNILVFTRASSPLYGVHMILKMVTEKNVEIEAFTKNDKETLLLVQFLTKALPDDATILPYYKTLSGNAETVQKAVLSMKEEVDFLSSTCYIHNVRENIEKEYSQIPSQAGTLVIPEQSYSKLKQALSMKECVTDQLIQSLCHVTLSKK